MRNFKDPLETRKRSFSYYQGFFTLHDGNFKS